MPRRTKKNQRGGNCGSVNGVKMPCNQQVNVDVHKCAPTLSQSEQAFSSRYFAGAKNTSNQLGGGYFLDVNQNRVGGLPEVQAVFDRKAPVYHPKSNALKEYPKPKFCNQQKGGAYNYIVNPETGRKVKLDGRKGKEVLRKYLNVQSGGAEGLPSNFDPNMSNRKFGCRQPEWVPDCI